MSMFTDGCRWFKIGYLIKRKSEGLTCFIDYKALAEKHHGKLVCKLPPHGGGEYTSNEFNHLLKQDGIEGQQATPYTPLSNGISERVSRTIIGTAQAPLDAVNAAKEYWGEAAMTAIYFRNQFPTKPIVGRETP